MPLSGKLGFNCPKCHLDHGSIQLYVEKSSKRRGKVRRTLSLRNEVGRKPKQERVLVKPVEYALFNKILSNRETTWMTEVSKSFEHPKFREVIKSMPHSEQQKLKTAVENTSSHIKARIEFESADRIEEREKYEKYNVTETLRTDSLAYSLIQANNGYNALNSKEIKDSGGSTRQKIIVRWNPIEIIKEYRRLGDPFRHLHLDLDFYARVIGMHPKLMVYLNVHKRELKKAFNVINRYRSQFTNHNWRYTWYEWFWITRYAQKKGFRTAQRMLYSLDGDGWTLSRKYIKEQISPTVNFWKKFKTHVPHFFEFLHAIQLFIPNNGDLKQENDKRLKQLEEKNLSDATKMVNEHLDRIAQHNYVPINDVRYGCKMCESLPTYYDDFKAIRKGPEHLRIYHSNPNYQKEMDQYKGGLRPEEPRRKTVCYIDPRELSPAIRAKLHQEGKVL